MTEQFLRYSYKHQRPIKVVYMDRDGIKTAALTCTDPAGDPLLFQKAGRKAPLAIAQKDLLACAYKRGDDGEIYAPKAAEAPKATTPQAEES